MVASSGALALGGSSGTRIRMLGRWRIAAVAVFLGAASAIALALTWSPALDLAPQATALLVLAGQLLVTLVLVLRAQWVGAGHAGWALLALAALAQVPPALAAHQETLGEVPAGYLGSPVYWALSATALVFGLLGVARIDRPHGLGLVLLNGLLAAITLASVAALVVVPWLEEVDATSGTAAAVALARPLADVLTVCVAVALLCAIGWSTSRGMRLLALGVALLALADVASFVLQRTDTEIDGRPAGAVALVGWLTMALAAWWDSQEPARTMSVRGHLSMAPILCLVVPAGILVATAVAEVPPTASLLAATAVGVTLLRLRVLLAGAITASRFHDEALTDELTGLPNRRHFYAVVRRTLVEAERREAPLALLLIDLDRFKEVNDSLGHSYGDELLARVGPRLSHAVRTEDAVARLGGDEFAIVLAPGSTSREAVAVARRVERALEAPFELDGFQVQVGASIGIALHPDHASSPDDLLARADVAMYHAKETGAIEFYRGDIDPHTRERLELKGQLHGAIEGGQLVAYFQPKLSLRTGRIEGVEALVRWRHPDRKLLAPASFLSLAHQSGLMRPLALAVLDQAVQQCAAWQAAGFHVHVDVNLSATNLLDDRLLSDVQRSLENAGLPPQALGIEVTEDVLLAEPARAAQVLTALRWRGVRIALDDFGSGYSSLQYLDRLPIDELKIDRYFVGRMTREPQASAIVRSTIHLAHSLGMTFVAEGVEDPAQLPVLRDLGCDSVQGYAVGRPMTGDQLTTLLRSQGSGRLPLPDGVTLEDAVPTVDEIVADLAEEIAVS
jgi:diguanylate cyclase (GGDEF)-like protein